MDDDQELKIRTPFLKSLVLHALLLALIYYLMTLQPDEGSNSKPIEVSVVDKKDNTKRTKVKPQTTAMGTAKHDNKYSGHQSHQVSLSDLGMRLNTSQVAEPEAPQENTATAQENPNTGDEWDLMNPDPKIARFNQYIYNTVQGWLDRDANLNVNPVHGTVKVKIFFDADGNFLESETVYEAMDPNFQMIVARALRKSFANPIPRPFLYVHHKFSIERMVVIRPF